LVQLPELDTLGGGREDTGRQYTAELKLGLTTMDKQPLCGWIVDLRENGGGNMWPMLQGLDPLLGKGPFGYFVARQGVITPWVRTPGGVFPTTVPMPDSTPSFPLAHKDAPLAVLIGPQTSSSGEMTALALIGRSGVRTFGAPSAGFTTANVPYPLTDGAFLVITETTVRDRSGKDYKGPIIPDEQVAILDAERAASEWLSRSC
jgi:C-terminal processing protease CtpA/Prc